MDSEIVAPRNTAFLALEFNYFTEKLKIIGIGPWSPESNILKIPQSIFKKKLFCFTSLYFNFLFVLHSLLALPSFLSSFFPLTHICLNKKHKLHEKETSVSFTGVKNKTIETH